MRSVPKKVRPATRSREQAGRGPGARAERFAACLERTRPARAVVHAERSLDPQLDGLGPRSTPGQAEPADQHLAPQSPGRPHRVVVEPAGVAGFAGLLRHRDAFIGQRVATVLCGGNLTNEQTAMWFA